MIATGETRIWTERINQHWKNAFAPQGETLTLAYEFIAINGVSLAVVPEKGIFRYDGGARQMGSAEVKDLQNASYLVQLDTGTIPDRLSAVAWGMEMFVLLGEHFPPQTVLLAVKRYWNDIYNAETQEAIEEILQASQESVALDPTQTIFP